MFERIFFFIGCEAEWGIRMKNDKEYLMLREEILHLDTVINNTINFFYAFVGAVLAYSIKQEDALFTLLPWVIIIPAYRIILGKRKNIFRIAAYLNVFHEGKVYNWERRQKRMYDTTSYGRTKKISSFNYPFIFVSTFVMIIFLLKTKWSGLGFNVELIKFIIGIVLYVMQIVAIIKNRKIDSEKYIWQWKKIKEEELKSMFLNC